jgi:nucleotide-binding universal stress UspA family protein
MSLSARVIVVGYDGSLPSKRAVTFAARRAGQGGRMVLVHASQRMDEAFLPGASPEGVFDAALEELAEGTPFETRTVTGPAARALVRAGRESAADEIVVGSRGVGLDHGGLGQVADRLLKETDRPVTVVPPGFDPDYPNAA